MGFGVAQLSRRSSSSDIGAKGQRVCASLGAFKLPRRPNERDAEEKRGSGAAVASNGDLTMQSHR